MGLVVAGLLGSLRSGSYNRALLRAAAELAPEGLTLEPARIDDLPPYDADVEALGLPPPVARLKAALAAADAVLFVSPEYNYSVPGFLKNAIDWVSRKPDPPLDGKPGAIMGASRGPFGTVRMQHHLRQIAVGLNMRIMTRPEVAIAKAEDRFDANGALADPLARQLVREAMAALEAWTRLLRRGPER